MKSITRIVAIIMTLIVAGALLTCTDPSGPEEGPDIPSDNIPLNLDATYDGTALTLEWQPSKSGTETQYEVSRSADSGNNYSIVGTTPGDTRLFLDSDVQADTIYYYRVRAFFDTDWRDYSAALYSSTEFQVAEDIKVQYGGEWIAVSWFPSKGGTETGYRIYKRDEDSTLELIGEVDHTEFYYDDESIERGETYFYAVETIYGENVGVLSGELEIFSAWVWTTSHRRYSIPSLESADPYNPPVTINMIAWDGEYVWICSSNTFYQVNPVTGDILSSFDIPYSDLTDCEFVEGCIYTIGTESDRRIYLIKYDSITGEQLGNRDVGGYSYEGGSYGHDFWYHKVYEEANGLTSDGGDLWATINTEEIRVTYTYDYHEPEWSSSHKYYYRLRQLGDISQLPSPKIKLKDYQIDRDNPVYGIAWDGEYLWVTENTDSGMKLFKVTVSGQEVFESENRFGEYPIMIDHF